MISVIYGAQGSGKTKRLIDAVNTVSENASGKVVFITDDDQSLDVKPSVKFLNLGEYGVSSKQEFIGFIKGLLAADFDIQEIFIDGLNRLLDCSADALKSVFTALNELKQTVNFVITVSAEKLPKFLKEYTVKE